MSGTRAALLLRLSRLLPRCTAREGWRGPPSDHFDGERFHNPVPFKKTPWDVLRFCLTADTGPWRRELDRPPAPPPPRRVGQGQLRVSVVNHATALLQFDGLNVLTDPVWSPRVSPLRWAGPRRYRPPMIRFEDLPPIDLVLVSHNHYDHLDLDSLRRLARQHDPQFLVPLGDGAILRGAGIARVAELDWWQVRAMPNGRALHAVPVQHWSGRSVLPSDQNKSLWLGYVIETDGGPVYFTGDTGYAGHFAEMRQRFGRMRLALLPIGAYEPRWFLAYQHLNPEEAVRAHRELGALRSVAVHWGSFKLTAEGQMQPKHDLAEALSAQGIPAAEFAAPENGEALDIPALSRTQHSSS